MDEPTKDEMIEAGGKLWEKGNMKRIYFNDSSIVKILDLNASDALKIKKTKPVKKNTYYCLVSESFYSANGMIIRNAIRSLFPKATVNKI